MARDYEVAFRLGAELSRSFKSAFKEANYAFKGLEEAGKRIRNVGSTLTMKVTAPLAGIGAVAVKTGLEFEKTMSKVQALSGATAEDMAKMEAQARELGKSTVFSASQAADAQAFLAMAGYNTNQILASMPGLLDLAAAGQMELGNAADITTNIMSAFVIEAEKTGHVADVLAKAASSANTDVEQLGEAIKYLGPVANSLGWGLEESTAAIMALSNSGIQGSMAGQAFASSLTRLTKEGGRGAKMAKELGIEFFNAQGQMKSLPEVIAELEKGLEGMTERQKASALEAMFGSEAYKHWATLINEGSEALANNTQMLVESEGAAKAMADTMTDNLFGDWNQFISALSELALQVYDIIQPVLRDITQWATKAVAWVQELSPQLKLASLAFAGVAFAIGPLLFVLGLLTSSFGQVSKAFSLLKFAFFGHPFGIIVTAIGALVAAFIYAWKNVDGFKERVLQILNVVKDYVINAFSVVTDFVRETISSIRAFWEQDGAQVIQAAINFFSMLKDFIDFVMPAILFVIEMVWNAIKQIITGTLNAIIGIVKIFTGIFTGDFSKMWEGVKLLFQGAIDVILGMMTFSFVGGIRTLLTNLARLGVNIVRNMWTSFANIFRNMGNAVRSSFTSLWESIINYLKNINLFSIGKSIVNGLINGIKSMGKSVLKAITNLVPAPLRKAASGVIGSLGVGAYAKGGIVTRPELAMIGEGGDTEAVIPWNNSQRAFDLWALTGQKIGAFNKLKSTPSPLPPNRIINNNSNQSSNITFTSNPTIIIQASDVKEGEVEKQIIRANRSTIDEIKAWQQNERRLAFE